MKPILPKGSKASKWTRIAIWTTLALATLWVADVVDRPIKMKKVMEGTEKLKSDLKKIWMAQTTQVDIINSRANAEIRKRNLKPGDPLPPNLFFVEGDRLWSAFNKEQRIQILTDYKVTAYRLHTYAEGLIGVENTVPQPGKPYAATYLQANHELVGSQGFLIYPKSPEATAIMKTAAAEVEEKQKNIAEKKARKP